MARRSYKINKVFCRKIGKKIKNLRMELGLSQEQLGFKAKMSGSFIGRIERGENDMPLSAAINVAKALNLTLPELVDVK